MKIQNQRNDNAALGGTFEKKHGLAQVWKMEWRLEKQTPKRENCRTKCYGQQGYQYTRMKPTTRENAKRKRGEKEKRHERKIPFFGFAAG
jgi:hypothetical protein